MMENSFREFIELAKYLLHEAEDVNRDDLLIIKRAISSFKSIIKVKVFDNILANSDALDRVIQEIDELISKYREEANTIESDLKKKVVSGGSKSLNIINRYIESLETLKKNIINNDYYALVEDFIVDKKSGQQLIDDCAISLSNGYGKFISLFGRPIVTYARDGVNRFDFNYEIIDKLIEISQNESLKHELIHYVEKTDSIDLISRCERSKDEVEGWNIAASNINLIKYYLRQVILLDKKQDLYTIYKDDLEAIEIELESIRGKGFRLFKSEEVIDRENKIAELKMKMKISDDIIAVLKERIEKYQVEIDKLNISDIISALIATYSKRKIVNNSQIKIPYMIRKNKNVVDDISQAQVEEELAHLEEFINDKIKVATLRSEDLSALMDEKKQTKEAELETLSEEAKLLVQEYPDDVRNMVTLFKSPDNQKRTPIICAYILKVLNDSSLLSYQDMNEVMGNPVIVDELIGSFQSVIDKYVVEQRDIMEVTNQEYTSELDEQKKLAQTL